MTLSLPQSNFAGFNKLSLAFSSTTSPSRVILPSATEKSKRPKVTWVLVSEDSAVLGGSLRVLEAEIDKLTTPTRIARTIAPTIPKTKF